MKKLTKRDYKKILPSDLYENAMLGKRMQGNVMQKGVNTRLAIDEYKELIEFLETIKVKRSAFIRYSIRKTLAELKESIKEHEEKKG